MGRTGRATAHAEAPEQILDDLRRIVHVLYGHSRRVERMARLTSAQAWLLTSLAKMEPTTVSGLSRSLRLSPSAVVRILGRLEERGLVVRTRSSDGRDVSKVVLTHVGTKLSEKIPAVPQGLLLKGLSEIPPKRLRTVSEGLGCLAEILGAGNVTPRLFFAPVANLPAGGGGAYPDSDKAQERGRRMIRKTYLRKVIDRLERFEQEIERLPRRVETPVGFLRDQMDRETRDLRAKADAVRDSIRAVEAAGASSWGRLKGAVDDGLKDLGHAIYEAVERLRKTGSGDR
jgi:DNA-binding MarR family transcriptional regulator